MQVTHIFVSLFFYRILCTAVECLEKYCCMLLAAIFHKLRKKSFLVRMFQQSQMLITKPKPRKKKVNIMYIVRKIHFTLGQHSVHSN